MYNTVYVPRPPLFEQIKPIIVQIYLIVIYTGLLVSIVLSLRTLKNWYANRGNKHTSFKRSMIIALSLLSLFLTPALTLDNLLYLLGYRQVIIDPLPF